MVNLRIKCPLPQRVITTIMAFLSIVMAYMLRVSLSYAITQMVIQPHASSNGTIISDPDICPPFEDEMNVDGTHPPATVHPISTDRFDWSQSLQGLILSSFYWGYIVTHIPGGLLSQKIGGKNTCLIGVFVATLCTLVSPLAIQTGGSTALIVLRVIVGAGEGFVFPSCSTLLAAWTPLKERSIAVSVVFSGGMIGSVIGSSCSGILIEQYGWTSVFYVFGTVSIVWCIVFALICTNNPETHPFISEREKNYLQRELGQLKRRTDLPPTPWRAILTSVPMIALIVAQIGHNWGLFIVITDLPKYMNDVLRFSIKKNGLYTALPYLCLWIVGISSGFLSDYLIKRNHLSITFSRKLFTSIAAIGPAIFIIFASYAGCDRGAVVAMFTLGMGFMGTFYSGIKANAIDLAPNYAGVIMALANGLGGLTGVIGPYIVGLLTENSLLTEWRVVFWITFVIFVVTTIVYVLFASGEVQPWNDTSEKAITIATTATSDPIKEKHYAEKPV